MAIILDVVTPTCCYNCPCYDGNDGNSRCMAAEKDVEDGNIRQEWCPIYGEIYLTSEKPKEVRISANISALTDSVIKTPEKWVRVGGIGEKLQNEVH